MEETWIYLCEDSLEGILTAVYTAYEEKHSHEKNRIEIAEKQFHQELFSKYIAVKTDFCKAQKVARTMETKISSDVYGQIQICSVSHDPRKADAIYRFIILALKLGARVMNHLTDPHVQLMMELERHTANEIQREIQFVRFEELENGVLFARINPENALLPYLAEHFSDRFSGENWVIADTVHQMVLTHERDKGCSLARVENVDFDALSLTCSENEQLWQKLWKSFVDTIAIKERINPKLQQQMLPLRFRKYMKEL